MNVEEAKKEQTKGVERWKGHKVAGVLLSVTGFLWLARKAGWMAHDSAWVMRHDTGGILLPVIVIVSGLLLVSGLVGRRRGHSR